MEIKGRNKQEEVLGLKALDSRLLSNHQEKHHVQSDLKIKKSEVSGEKEVDYPLSFLNEEKFLILHNLRIPDQLGFFQMDSVLFKESFGLILEVKNWKGTVLFHKNGQVTRLFDGMEEGFKNPIAQVKIQQHRLQKWFRSQGITNYPIFYLVVISFPQTIIKPATIDVKIPNEVIHNSELLFKIQEIEQKFLQTIVEMPKLLKVAHNLKDAHTPPRLDVLQKYKIYPSELLRGVFCLRCSYLPMIRWKKKWYCRKCGFFSSNAHVSALNDYKLLIANMITNQEAREFLRTDSPHVIKRIMSKEGYQIIGRKKSSKYELILK